MYTQHMSISLLLLCAQIVGGSFDPYLSIHGVDNYDKLGFGDVAGVGDINGDGLGDFLVGKYRGAGEGAKIYSGSDLTVLRDYNNGGVGSFGRRLGNAGDTDGDGVTDYLIAAPDLTVNGMQWAGEVYLYSGASGALLTTISGTEIGQHIGQVKGAGDINNDGHDDFFVGAYMEDQNGVEDCGALYIYSGLDYALLHKTTGTIIYASWGSGGSFDGGFDINLDGFDDFIAGSAVEQLANVYSGADGSILFSYSGLFLDGFGDSVCMTPDANNDGNPDFCISAYRRTVAGDAEAGEVMLYSGADGSLIRTFSGDHWFNRFGDNINYVGDVNGDGKPDLGVGSPAANSVTGSVRVYDLASGDLLQATVGAGDGNMGEHVVWVGDTTGDGKDNILTTEPHSSSNGYYLNGAVHVIDFNPILTSTAVSVSASAGGQVQFDINFSRHFRQHYYKILGSNLGIGPSTISGLQIPLTDSGPVWDALLVQPPPGFFASAFGVLDENGDATATLDLPAGVANGLVGSTLHFSVVGAVSGTFLEQVSVAVPVLILP